MARFFLEPSSLPPLTLFFAGCVQTGEPGSLASRAHPFFLTPFSTHPEGLLGSRAPFMGILLGGPGHKETLGI